MDGVCYIDFYQFHRTTFDIYGRLARYGFLHHKQPQNVYIFEKW
jgi:hypothetical protein